jgi:hypothetical protein
VSAKKTEKSKEITVRFSEAELLIVEEALSYFTLEQDRESEDHDAAETSYDKVVLALFKAGAGNTK